MIPFAALLAATLLAARPDASIPLPTTVASTVIADAPPPAETPEARDARMEWWREARFGMFIHWGLYAVAAGEWDGKNIPGAGEWMLTNAKVKPEDYEPLQKRFNPVKFNAKRWVEIAKNAGMKYIVITSKHHDGFCLWDSKLTDWDVMNTPFGRDILKELADACKEGGIRLCFYHSIMDWHHPDYLPRRAWDTRPTEGASFDRYREYMKGELKELLSGTYGQIGVLWFDGEWENTWNHEYATDLDDWVRAQQPSIIVNNRVDVGREGMAGVNRKGGFRGDFGTPEQEIPPTGFTSTDGRPVDWETCMTMNNTWGFHRHDHDWKPTERLIRMLCDIASKGGNFLLNVGPTGEGEIPPESVERLAAMGAWLKTNGESIYDTTPSLFPSLAWGRSTTKLSKASSKDGATLYFQVFDWPHGGTLVVPGLLNKVTSARLLANGSTLTTSAVDGELRVQLPETAPDPIASVVALVIEGAPQILPTNLILPLDHQFVQAKQVMPAPMPPGVTVRYTTDRSAPTAKGAELVAIAVRETTVVKARAFVDDRPVGPVSEATFERLEPWPAVRRERTDSPMRLEYAAINGDFKSIDDLIARRPASLMPAPATGLGLPTRFEDHFGLYFHGYFSAPHEAIWTWRLGSDDGSRLVIDGHVVVNNDGPHSYKEMEGSAPLAKGIHELELWYFERDGQQGLKLEWMGGGLPWQTMTARSFLSSNIR